MGYTVTLTSKATGFRKTFTDWDLEGARRTACTIAFREVALDFANLDMEVEVTGNHQASLLQNSICETIKYLEKALS